jgi:hypothetical protein
MVQRVDSNDYRAAGTAEVCRMLDRGTIRLEGVDGDEDANTVTYWYTREEGDR